MSNPRGAFFERFPCERGPFGVTTMTLDIDTLMTRVREQFAEQTGDDFELFVHRWNNGYRLRIKPNYEKTGESWESDISPYCDTADEFRAYLQGVLTTESDITRKAELMDD